MNQIGLANFCHEPPPAKFFWHPRFVIVILLKNKHAESVHYWRAGQIDPPPPKKKKF